MAFFERFPLFAYDIKNDGTFRIDQSYFDYSTGIKMTNSKFRRLIEYWLPNNC